MADIKQAAEWLKEEKRIRRTRWIPSKGYPLWIVADEGDSVVREDTGSRFDFYTYDLNADDWEVAP